MTGYVFYCSKCKVDHAGECPPEITVQVNPAPKFIIGYVPQPGSRWVAQDQNGGGPWTGRAGDLYIVYEVVAITADRVMVREAGTQPFGLTHDWWDEEGHHDTNFGLAPGSTHRVRMVPAP